MFVSWKNQNFLENENLILKISSKKIHVWRSSEKFLLKYPCFVFKKNKKFWNMKNWTLEKMFEKIKVWRSLEKREFYSFHFRICRRLLWRPWRWLRLPQTSFWSLKTIKKYSCLLVLKKYIFIKIQFSCSLVIKKCFLKK